MQATLLSLLGMALFGVLHGQEEVTVQPDFQQEKFTGKWYSIGLASSSRWFMEKKQVLKMCTTVITPTADGNLNVTSTYPKQDGCKKIDLVFEKTGQLVSGYHLFLSTEMGKQDMRVVATDYTNYAIVYTFKDDDGKSSTTLQLYSRIQEVNPEAMKIFKELYPPMGLTDNMLVILPKSGKCHRAPDSFIPALSGLDSIQLHCSQNSDPAGTQVLLPMEFW
uniref:Prostaglandin D2 synthase n=1 Tax=Chelonoidis abingdonii TaxID=106734 RepID=A0A8C0HCP1_CHEAB